MIYFTSDLHLGHQSVLYMQKRPFADVREMNETILANFNALVSRNDTVYLLGDVCYRIALEEANELIARMNGKKILVRGNHDKNYDPSLFEEICDVKFLSAYGMHFTLMHYPMQSWPKLRWGAIHLHGHMHYGPEYNEQNIRDGVRRYDVGVDANHYYPVSAKQILEAFGEKFEYKGRV